ncbi:MAG: helix-turn-helix domain-containing protein [Alphaproteobacteria bacterium]
MAQEEIIFPNNIRNIRASRGMKMTELARRANLSLSAVSKIEKGVRRLNQKQLLNVCTILGCKLSDIFIHESDAVAQNWQKEIKRRLTDNEGSGLKVFGSGLRKIRQRSEKTIADAAHAANMTLSVYHKIEVGQREVYENEIDVLAKAFGYTASQLFDEIAKLYNNGELTKQINKVTERVKSVIEPRNPSSGLDINGGLYGAQLYDNARKKLVPVFGTPNGKSIKLKKSDETMIVAPSTLEGRSGIYAVVPNSKRVSGFIPETAYVFADANIKPKSGDLAVCIDADFSKLKSDEFVEAQIALIRQDTHGKTYGHISNPEEKVNTQTMHKIVMIVMR